MRLTVCAMFVVGTSCHLIVGGIGICHDDGECPSGHFCQDGACVQKSGTGGGSAATGGGNVSAGGGSTSAGGGEGGGGGTGATGGGSGSTGGGTGTGGTGGGCQPETDAELCLARAVTCGPLSTTDRCAMNRNISSCGSCASPGFCDAGIGCSCNSENDMMFCSRLGKACGPHSANDNCNRPRSVTSCGTCTVGVCDAGVCPNCTPENNTMFCSRLGATCGSVTAPDNCGTMRTVPCGSCTLPNGCGDGGTPNQCGCRTQSSAELCALAGKNCGTVNVVDQCDAGRSVGCGTCTDGGTCQPNNICGCAPESNGVFCSNHGKNCGNFTGVDTCGATRTNVNCGSTACGCGIQCVSNVCTAQCSVNQGGGCSCAAECCSPATECGGTCCRPLGVGSGCGAGGCSNCCSGCSCQSTCRAASSTACWNDNCPCGGVKNDTTQRCD